MNAPDVLVNVGSGPKHGHPLRLVLYHRDSKFPVPFCEDASFSGKQKRTSDVGASFSDLPSKSRRICATPPISPTCIASADRSRRCMPPCSAFGFRPVSDGGTVWTLFNLNSHIVTLNFHNLHNYGWVKFCKKAFVGSWKGFGSFFCVWALFLGPSNKPAPRLDHNHPPGPVGCENAWH